MNAPQQETAPRSSVERSIPASFSIDELRAAEKCEKFVAFFLGNSIFWIPSSTVLEVVHPLPVAELPNAPSSILGITAFKGDVVAVVNIKKVLGLEESAANGKAKLIILRANAKETQIAVPVDSMHEMTAVLPDAISSDPNAASGGLTRLVEYEGSVFKMIVPGVLFKELEQSIA